MGFFNRSEHPQELISAFVDGELAARQSESVARHIAGCDECTALLGELREARAMLAALPREAPRRSFVLGPEHARGRVAAAARQAPRRSSFSFAPAIAATVLIGLLFADAINLQSSSQDESTGGLAGASQRDLAGRQSIEDGSKGAPMPATAAESANSTTAADSAVTPMSGGGAGPGTAPATGPVAPPATGPGVPAATPVTGQTGSTAPPPPNTGRGNLPAQTAGPLSTFGTEGGPPQPAEDADGFAGAEDEEDDGGVSTLRVLQILATIALVGSVLYVYVRPRIIERKSSE
jgi:anti-sigma factor RsiW